MKRQFGKYRLLDKIAIGGMAEIWLARQTGVKGFEKLVVLKKILPEFTRNPEFVDMFLNEARVAAMLTHSNVVQIYDLGKVGNIYYIAMEYIFGQSLDQLLIQSVKKGAPLPLQFSCNIISQSATGLHYAHNMKDIYGVPMNIVHRDISPQNILVSYEGIAKVVDFGIAKANTQGNDKTQVGQIKGKVAYMSPEQIRAEKLDGRSDVFALAVVLYEITTGKRLFPHITNPFEIMNSILNKDITPPHVLNSQYPEILSRIIMKALHKDKTKRYQTALSFSHDLERFLKSFNTPVFSNDVANWLKKVFQSDIQAIKSRHEQLLWEDNDSSFHEEEETTNLLQQQSRSQNHQSFDTFDDDDEEATIIAPVKIPPKPKSKTPQPPSTPPSRPQRNSAPKKPKANKMKALDDDFFDFPDETVNKPKKKPAPPQAPSKNQSRKSSRQKNNQKNNQKTRKKQSRVQKPLKSQVFDLDDATDPGQRKRKPKPHKSRVNTEDKTKIRKAPKKQGSALGWIIKKLLLVVIIYSLYFSGLFAYKYVNTEQRFDEIIENAVKQDDEKLSIEKSIEFFCQNTEDVICINKSFKVSADDQTGTIRFNIDYEMKENLLTKWPVKVKISAKRELNYR